MHGSANGIGAVVVTLVLGCGPTPATSGSGGGGEGTGGATTTDTGLVDGSVSSAAGDDDTGDSIEPKYDVPKGPPPPTSACGYPLEPECTPTWPPEEQLAANANEATAMPGQGVVSVWIDPPYPDDVLTIASLAFDMPCPVDAGAPKVTYDRFDVDAELTIMSFGGFEWSLVGIYPAVVDAQFLNACLHLQIHGIAVGAEALEPPGAPLFEWDGIIEPGYVYAPIQ